MIPKWLPLKNNDEYSKLHSDLERLHIYKRQINFSNNKCTVLYVGFLKEGFNYDTNGDWHKSS